MLVQRNFPEKSQRKYHGDYTCQSEDDKALGVAGELHGNQDKLPDRQNCLDRLFIIHNSAAVCNSLMLTLDVSRS
jgi:hypothetical protein